VNTLTSILDARYSHLVKPLDKTEIRQRKKETDKDFVGTYANITSLGLFEYHEPSPFPHADACSIIGARESMEDTYLIAKLPIGAELYGVFDGHGGWKISVLLKDVLAKKFAALLDDKDAFDYTDKVVVTELVRKVCLDIGEDIFGLTDCIRTGSTAVFALKFQQYVYLVNIGDSTGIILDEKYNVLLRTKSHKPTDEDEKKRITLLNGNVWMGRVDGCLAVSRSFGDNGYNTKGQDVYLGFETIVSHEPDVYQYIVPEESSFYLVLGSDGLWDYCRFEETTTLANTFPFTQLAETVVSNSPRKASQEIVNMAFQTNVYDNISAVVVNLTRNPTNTNDMIEDNANEKV